MQKLPRGYYAVASDFENASKTEFVYKGVCYAVEAGVDLFATVHEAEKAIAKDETAPDTVLEGLTYDAFEGPVVLFSAGRHKIDRYNPTRNRYLLGQGACVSPNLPAARGECPELNPARADEAKESVLFGTFYYGYVEIKSPDAKIFVQDGFVLEAARSFDTRSAAGGHCSVIFRNNIYKSPCGQIVHNFIAQKEELHREVRIENSRLQNFDDLGYGGVLIPAEAERTVIDGLCYDNTTQMFGFNSMPRDCSNYACNVRRAEFVIKNSYFRDLHGERGIATGCTGIGENGMDFIVENSTFVNASREGEAVLNPHLANEKCTLTVRNCSFWDTRGNAAAITVLGDGDAIRIENTTFEGFDTVWNYEPKPPENAPAYIENRDTDWESGTEDSHTVLAEGSADFSKMDALYEGKRAYYADQHTHTNCGGSSDGTYPMNKWVAKMDELGVDFAFVVDHMQMRGFFLPEWDTDRFVYGTEPGTKITDPKGCKYPDYMYFHYNMHFPHEYGLAMLLANFPEFKFHGDELTGRFGYPHFTRERFEEMVAYIHKIGGMISHPHPKSLLASDDPMDYYFGERTYLETLYFSPTCVESFRNYELWCKILALGKHVLASGGTDAHGTPHGSVVSTFYCPERTGKAAFDCMKSGDYAVGDFGMKMCVDGAPMGSENVYREGSILTLRVDDGFTRHIKDGTVFELRVYSDEGLVYASAFDGKHPQALAIKTQKRKFYRAEVFDLTRGCRVGIGNPVWLDKVEQSAEA